MIGMECFNGGVFWIQCMTWKRTDKITFVKTIVEPVLTSKYFKNPFSNITGVSDVCCDLIEKTKFEVITVLEAILFINVKTQSVLF